MYQIKVISDPKCSPNDQMENPKSCNSWDFFMGYLSDLCLSNHLQR